MTGDHYSSSNILEDAEGAAFAYCGCGWVSEGFADEPVPEGQPPHALDMAYRARYGHIYRTQQLGLSA